MFKITCFAPIEPSKLEGALRGIHFQKVKNGFEWKLDSTTFRIEPFQNQPRESMKAYRIYFDGSIEGCCYLFDLSMGAFGGIITGIEYLLEDPRMKYEDWLKDLRKKSSYKMVDPRGLFTKENCVVVVVQNTVTIQLRSKKNQKLKMVDCLKKVDLIREELMPDKYDLFSLSNSEIEIA
jgi:hypothetical protein